MERMIIRHRSGSKAGQTETFDLASFTDITLGRDAGAGIRMDPERDDLVGRRHARIERDPADPARFLVRDLNSRNGTFLNRQRVTSEMVLTPGDVLQLGAGGPMLEFTLDPLPPAAVKLTRVIEDAAETRGGTPRRTSGSAALGKQTVLRLIEQARRQTDHRTTRTALGVAAALLVVLALGFADLARERDLLGANLAETRSEVEAVRRDVPMSAAEIARRYADATVFIEVGWKLFATDTGGQIYHEYYVEEAAPAEPPAGTPPAEPMLRPTRRFQADAGNQPQPRAIPLYLRLPDGTIEPSLTRDAGRYGQNQPIGGTHTGSGFVVNEDGFILTNRHVAATWETAYPYLPPGIVYDLQTQQVERLDQPPVWVPANSRLLGRRAVIGKHIEGRFDYLDVTFARSSLRIPARLVRVSDRHDAALVKVDVTQPLEVVETFDNYDAVEPGAPITVMGYPAISPDVLVASRSGDWSNREAQVRSVPDPTITPGAIGRVLRGQAKPSTGSELDYYSEIGDAYQLTINATGGGNSGGPLFDDRGRVIGIFFAGRSDASGTRISFAVPIRYGLELMGIAPVL